MELVRPRRYASREEEAMRAAVVTTLGLALAAALGRGTAGEENPLVLASDPRIGWMGRFDTTDPVRPRFGYPGVTVRVAFEGPSIGLRVAAATPNVHVLVRVDGDDSRIVRLPEGESDLGLAGGLDPGAHTAELVHRTETWQGTMAILGVRLAPGGRLLAAAPFPRRKLMFVGDSVTCGSGAERASACAKDGIASSNGAASYGMLLGRALDAQSHLVCYGGRGLVRDWRGRRDVHTVPEVFDLTVPDEPKGPTWDHARYVPDAVVVSIGTNDLNLAIGPFPERDEYVGAYVAFLQTIRARYPKAFIFATEGAIVNDGPDGRKQKTTLASWVAEAVQKVGDPRVRAVASTHYPGDACDAHPTAEQHAAMARDFEPILREALGW
jgi:lysophospholipase L1-like esterase